MQRIALIGSNIAHSRSPYFHNHLFARFNLPLRYELMPLAADDVIEAIAMMKRDGYRGANITSPHKLVAMPALDELSGDARAIGAVNTIVFEGGRAVGHNTDAHGFARSLDGVPLMREPFTAAVLGAGGAAMAAVHALAGNPMLRELTIYSREAGRAMAAAARWNHPRVLGAGIDRFAAADMVINATPVGLPATPGLPVDPDRLAGTRLLYEMIYSPAETALAAAARRRGIGTMNGRAMFAAQALAAFGLWTGVDGGAVPEGLWGEGDR